MPSLRNAVLVNGARTAFARGAKGKLVATRLDEAGAQVIRALLDRNPKVRRARSRSSRRRSPELREVNRQSAPIGTGPLASREPRPRRR
jgi:acetyl-CoA acetyltransferase